MKKCPSCEKTFDDSMRFCQVDGTPLVDEAPAFDPYATIVAQPIPPMETAPVEEAPVAEVPSIEEPEPVIHQTIGSVPIAPPEDVLDLPSVDPLKTMYVSDAEMQAAISGDAPFEESPSPEPPSFLAPEVESPATSEMAPPPSPFSVVEPGPVEVEPAAPAFEPEPEPFQEAPTMIQPDFNPPFEPATAPVQEWTPPPAPDASWQNQEIGSNTPFQPPMAGMEGQNKTLAIVSLVLGILGMTVCCGGLLPSIAAIITGVMARGKVNENPAEYGGSGMAMGGLITGVIGLILGIIVIILQVVLGVFSAAMNN